MPSPVESPVAGTVRLIEVELGDELEPGDVVVVLQTDDGEAPVEADAAGRVITIDVAEGERVAEGDALAVLD